MFRQGCGFIAVIGAISAVITVIKLGGSLLNAKVLPDCLKAIERYSGTVLIVPGGGMFADQVRSAQCEWNFDDRAAHRMAILAMQQMALLFNSLKPHFSLLPSVSQLSDLPKVGIWSPDPDELDAAGIAASWDITSDSLAACLASQVRADELLLVKSCQLDKEKPLAELQREGIIDSGFHKMIAEASFKITVINKDCFLSLHDQVNQIAAE